jgi:hypothetical protein
MTMTPSFVTTGTAFARAIAENGRERRDDDADADAARAWIARQWRFERLLRTLEQETDAAPANPSSDSK